MAAENPSSCSSFGSRHSGPSTWSRAPWREFIWCASRRRITPCWSPSTHRCRRLVVQSAGPGSHGTLCRFDKREGSGFAAAAPSISRFCSLATAPDRLQGLRRPAALLEKAARRLTGGAAGADDRPSPSGRNHRALVRRVRLPGQEQLHCDSSPHPPGLQ